MEMEGERRSAGQSEKSIESCFVMRFGGLLATMGQVGVALFALLLITERDALAYSDPGSGALIWQMLVASLFGGMFYFRKIVSSIRFWMRKEGSGEEKNNKTGPKE